MKNMAMEDWIKKGEDWYKLKGGKGELSIHSEPYDEIHRIGSKITKVVKKTRYLVIQSYQGDGNQPDYHVFKTRMAAHNWIMKHVKTKDY